MIKFILGLSLVLGTQQLMADELLDLLEGPTESIVSDSSSLVKSLKKDIGRVTAEQVIFFQFLNKKNYKKALFQWEAAFGHSKYQKTANAKALHALLLYKNDLHLNALEQLIQIKKIENLHPELASLWKEMVPEESDLWSLLLTKWNPKWDKVFGSDIGALVRSHRISASTHSVSEILSSLKLSKPETEARAWLEWQIVLAFALENKPEKAVKVLSHLMKTQQDLIGKDIMHITAARMLYQRGYLNAAINYYNKVPKSSEYWFVAQEEAAWAFIRKGEAQNTLAITRSLMPNEFRAQVGPESVFLRSLAQLKLCNYSGVIGTVKVFKDRFRTRAKHMLEISRNANNKDVEFLFSKLKKSKIRLLDLKDKALRLPRYVSRDERLYKQVQALKHFEEEAKTASKLYSNSLSEGTAKVGFQAKFEKLKNSFLQRSYKAKSEALEGVKQLAKAELDHIHQTLQKMHIVEAELVQQVAMADRVIKDNVGGSKNQKGSTGSKSAYSLEFIANDELWFDEIGNYKVNVNKACTVVKGKTI